MKNKEEKKVNPVAIIGALITFIVACNNIIYATLIVVVLCIIALFVCD